MWLLDRGAFPMCESPVASAGAVQGKPADERLSFAKSLFYQPPTYWKALITAVPGGRAWEAALAELETDANAPLPA